MIEISKYGYRDGAVNARIVTLGQKRLTRDTFVAPVASNTALKVEMDFTSTTSYTLGTAIDYPRAVKFVNGLGAASERKMNVIVKGYSGQGEYVEELVTLSSNATGRTAGNVAFAYISEVVPATSTKGYGTYSTVSIYPTETFGLSDYIDSSSDVLGVDVYAATTLARTTSTVAAAKVNLTYQTANLLGKGFVGSTAVVKYLSKFQKDHRA